jgi:rhodanese-related sulfurtransferase
MVKKLKIKTLSVIVVIITVMIICGLSISLYITNNRNFEIIKKGEENMEKDKYAYVSASQMVEQIKKMNKEDYVILDVRTKEEYDEERIPNSVLLTLDEIENKAGTILPNKDIRIYVYCRTGRRSEQAAYKLIKLGYTNVYDIGGIINYPYDKTKGVI